MGLLNTTMIELGESKQIICSASASPPANVTWFRTVNASTPIVSSVGSSVLRIDNFNDEDVGYYRCIAVNKFGRASHTTYLKSFSIGIIYITSLLSMIFLNIW